MRVLFDFFSQRINQTLQATLLLIIASIAFAVMNVGIRASSEMTHISVVMAVRTSVALIVMLPWAFSQGSALFVSKHWGLHWSRSLFGTATMALLFWAMAILPVAEVVTLSFTLPLFGLLGAIFILREKVGLRRSMATLVGFVGVVLYMQPTRTQFDFALLIPIVSAMGMAGAALSMKALTNRGESGTKVAFFFALISTPIMMIYASFYWSWPGWTAMSIMILVGLCGAIGQTCLANAYQRADASYIMTLDFLRLPFSAFAAYVILGQIVDLGTLPGMALILGSALYIGLREGKLRKEKSDKSRAASAVMKGKFT